MVQGLLYVRTMKPNNDNVIIISLIIIIRRDGKGRCEMQRQREADGRTGGHERVVEAGRAGRKSRQAVLCERK